MSSHLTALPKEPDIGGHTQWRKIRITHGKKGVKVNNAKATTADLMATNGVIHVVDNVLLPPKK